MAKSVTDIRHRLLFQAGRDYAPASASMQQNCNIVIVL
jgi:hypothetical protein